MKPEKTHLDELREEDRRWQDRLVQKEIEDRDWEKRMESKPEPQIDNSYIPTEHDTDSFE